MKTRYYVAYGSNLNITQMKYRCPNAKIVGTAFIDGYELLFKGSKTGSYLTIEPKQNSKVPVAIWSVTESDELNLDRYEGFPTFYYKKSIIVNVSDINTGKISRKKCFVYIMHEDRKIGIPSTFYMQTCADGYSYFNFDISYLSKAYNKSVNTFKNN